MVPSGEPGALARVVAALREAIAEPSIPHFLVRDDRVVRVFGGLGANPPLSDHLVDTGMGVLDVRSFAWFLCY